MNSGTKHSTARRNIGSPDIWPNVRFKSDDGQKSLFQNTAVPVQVNKYIQMSMKEGPHRFNSVELPLMCRMFPIYKWQTGKLLSKRMDKIFFSSHDYPCVLCTNYKYIFYKPLHPLYTFSITHYTTSKFRIHGRCDGEDGVYIRGSELGFIRTQIGYRYPTSDKVPLL